MFYILGGFTMRIKNNRINLLINVENDFLECEVHLFGTIWYHLYSSLTDDMLDLLNEYNNRDITLLELLEYWYDSIKFEDEYIEQKPREFTTEEWEYILEGL